MWTFCIYPVKIEKNLEITKPEKNFNLLKVFVYLWSGESLVKTVERNLELQMAKIYLSFNQERGLTTFLPFWG